MKSKACRPARVQPAAASSAQCGERGVERAAVAAELGCDGAEPGGARIVGAHRIEAAASVISAEVSVPVLSVHSTVIAPRSWIEARRLTITLRRAIRSAPRDSVTVVIIGSSSGVSPTASATANISESSTGRPKSNPGREHHDHETEGQPRDDEAELMQVALEGRRCLGFGQRRCRCAEHRAAAGADDQRDRFAGLRDSAAKQRVRCFAWTCRCHDAGPLLDRIGLAGQRGFAGGEGCAFENQRVGRNDVAGPDAQDVARHDLIYVDFTKRAARV